MKRERERGEERRERRELRRDSPNFAATSKHLREPTPSYNDRRSPGSPPPELHPHITALHKRISKPQVSSRKLYYLHLQTLGTLQHWLGSAGGEPRRREDKIKKSHKLAPHKYLVTVAPKRNLDITTGFSTRDNPRNDLRDDEWRRSPKLAETRQTRKHIKRSSKLDF
jgi:hypothetical protein